RAAAVAAPDPRARAGAHHALPHRRSWAARPCAAAVRGEPAESRAGARVLRPSTAAHRVVTDSRARRRRDRDRVRVPQRCRRRRGGDPPRQRRPGRDPRARRPDRGHVRRRDCRRDVARAGKRRGARSAHGRGAPRVRIERRLRQPRWLIVAVPTASLVFAFFASGLVLLATGHDALSSYRQIFEAAFTSNGALGQTLTAATPLAFTGLAAAAAFRMRLFNIGGEGQLYVGAITADAAGLYLGG